jgi:hypothetical protein
MVREATGVVDQLVQLGRFFASTEDGSAPPLSEAAAGMIVCLEALGGWLEVGAFGEAPRIGDRVIPRMSEQTHECVDPIEVAFATPAESLYGGRGSVSDARQLAVWRGRLADLEARYRALLAALTPDPPGLFSGVAPLLDLLRAPRPLIAWWAAEEALALMKSVAGTDPTRVLEVCVELQGRAEQVAASKEGLQIAIRQREAADTEALAALAALGVYRRLAEGQIRNWAWAMLRLRGASGDPPMLGELRDRLASDGHPLFSALAAALVPVLRNADAHEDAHYDESQGALLVRGQVVASDDVETACDALHAYVAGFEMAFACARATIGVMQQALTVEPTGVMTASQRLKIAEQRYGHAGLSVYSIRRDRDTVRVLLDGLDPRKCNPCFLATVQANAWVRGVARWQISIRERDAVVIDLPTRVLDANLPLFEQAAHWFPVMPVSTFVPCLTWSRLAVELPGESLKAAAWFVLNDAQEAIDTIEESGVLDRSWLARRFMLATAAAATTLTLMPPAEAQPLWLAHDLVRAAGRSVSGFQSEDLPLLIREIRREHARLMVPAVLPTLDKTPLDAMEGGPP